MGVFNYFYHPESTFEIGSLCNSIVHQIWHRILYNDSRQLESIGPNYYSTTFGAQGIKNRDLLTGLFNFNQFLSLVISVQGGRSCAGARVAPAKKFRLGRKFEARTYAILSQIKICRDLRTFFWDIWAKKVPFWVKTVLPGQEVHYYMV